MTDKQTTAALQALDTLIAQDEAFSEFMRMYVGREGKTALFEDYVGDGPGIFRTGLEALRDAIS